MQSLLLANGVIAAPDSEPLPGMCRAFPSLDEARALLFCQLLATLLGYVAGYGLRLQRHAAVRRN